MAGIAGIARPARTAEVNRMLDKLAHRGRAARVVIETDHATMGAAAPGVQTPVVVREKQLVQDHAEPARCAVAQVVEGRLTLRRDPLGVAPLYYGFAADGALCFASEVKALVGVAHSVQEFPPGANCDGDRITRYFDLHAGVSQSHEDPRQIAALLKNRLTQAAQKCVQPDVFGAWLSGGLDSSALTAVARPYTRVLHTFAGGLAGSEDLLYARHVAEFLRTEHHECVVTPADLLRVLPEVIYHLESFDALLVRSSVVNFIVAGHAAEFVPAVLSGEGGDELFAGYEYLRDLPAENLEQELLDITKRLHNTALQRVDRCAGAHGQIAYPCFLDPNVVELALRIPVELKLHGKVEKWIVRQALAGLLPQSVLERRKSKFWQGSGVGGVLAEHAERTISDDDFHRERRMKNGWTLNSKEELMYYRFFREQFGELEDLSWMGRTKTASPAGQSESRSDAHRAV